MTSATSEVTKLIYTVNVWGSLGYFRILRSFVSQCPLWSVVLVFNYPVSHFVVVAAAAKAFSKLSTQIK